MLKGKYTRAERNRFNTYYKDIKKFIDDSLGCGAVHNYNLIATDQSDYIRMIGRQLGKYAANGFDINYRPNVNHDYLLTYALDKAKAKNKTTDLFEMLVELMISEDACNADVNVTKNGLSSLMLAVSHNWKHAIVPKIMAKADINYCYYNMSVLDYAIVCGVGITKAEAEKSWGPNVWGIHNKNIPLLIEAGATAHYEEIWKEFEEIGSERIKEDAMALKAAIEVYLEQRAEIKEQNGGIFEYEI